MTGDPRRLILLDLEGTLISNAISQIPRPNLFEFLVSAHDLGDLALFTSVSQQRTQDIQRRLVDDKSVPSWFSDIPSIHPEGTIKEKRQVASSWPNFNEWLLVDEQADCV